MMSYNFKNDNGRINQGRPGLNVLIPPTDPLFNTQVESGVQNCVFALGCKGYITLGSCEGHPPEADPTNDTYWHISIAYDSDRVFEVFQRAMKWSFVYVKHDSTYPADLDWFNRVFEQRFNQFNILTIYTSSNTVKRNQLAKRCFAKHCLARINKLPLASQIT